MATILKTKSVYYNDCNLIAQPSHPLLKSRKDIPVELNRLIVSPMDAVVGKTFAVEATRLGLSVCLHRFCDANHQLEILKAIRDENLNLSNVYVSIGLEDWDRVSILKDYTSNWLIDCANGYLSTIKNTILKLQSNTSITNLMLGNIHTKEGVSLYKEFDNCGFNIMFRTGIAGGSACATSDMTGVNRGQITEIIECSDEAQLYNNFYIIADGGIKNGNYAAKSFGAGADYVMLGGFFAKAKEAETHIIGDGTYWGGASTKQQERYGGKRRHSEGKVYKIEETPASLHDLIFGDNGIWGGLSSTISYSGYNSLTAFIGHGVFEIKENSLPPGGR